MKLASSQPLYHKALFTVGDRSFRWEYPPDSPLTTLKKGIQEPKKSPMPKVLTPNNRQTKGTAASRFNAAKSIDDFKKDIPKLG